MGPIHFKLGGKAVGTAGSRCAVGQVGLGPPDSFRRVPGPSSGMHSALCICEMRACLKALQAGANTLPGKTGRGRRQRGKGACPWFGGRLCARAGRRGGPAAGWRKGRRTICFAPRAKARRSRAHRRSGAGVVVAPRASAGWHSGALMCRGSPSVRVALRGRKRQSPRARRSACAGSGNAWRRSCKVGARAAVNAAGHLLQPPHDVVEGGAVRGAGRPACGREVCVRGWGTRWEGGARAAVQDAVDDALAGQAGVGVLGRVELRVGAWVRGGWGLGIGGCKPQRSRGGCTPRVRVSADSRRRRQSWQPGMHSRAPACSRRAPSNHLPHR
jgi:hypothetical protein